MDRTLGLVVPAYRPDTERLVEYVTALAEGLAPAVIRVELDAATPEVIDRLEAAPASVHAVARRRGKGAAITAGFERLETDVKAFADADGSTLVDSMTDVVTPVLAGEVALAVGSRRHPDSTVVSHQTLVRRRLGDAFAALARAAIEPPLYDYQCGAKAIDAEAWQRVRQHLYEPGFAWDVELIGMSAALGLPIREVPIVWEDHPGSTVSPLRSALDFGRTLLAVRHRAKLLADDPVHTTLERWRKPRPALVDRPEVGR